MTNNAVAQLSVALETFKVTRQMNMKTNARRVGHIVDIDTSTGHEHLVPQQQAPRDAIVYTPVLSVDAHQHLAVFRLVGADIETTSYGIFAHDKDVYAPLQIEEVASLLAIPSETRLPTATLERVVIIAAEAADRLQMAHAS